MMRKAAWFHSFVPGDVGWRIRMSEGLDYSTLLVSATYHVQLACHVRPHMQEKRHLSDVQVSWEGKKL